MNQDRFEGICRQFSGAVQKHWGRLTRNPDAVSDGAHAQLAGKIQERRGVSREQVERQLKDFFVRNRNWDLLNR